ncbi:MAG: citrate transporter, partial [Candidatus Rifleibacteriota bacterium]
MIGFAILIIFLIAAILMFLRKLPAILALPMMALGIGLVEWLAGKLTLHEISYAIFADGSLRLSEAIVISMVGGMVSFLMQKAGVAEKFIRIGAELAGDDPWTVSLITLALISVLFTTIGGLGAVIMVGTIVLPILASLGLRDYVCGAIVLFGISLGGLINPGNWAMYTSVLQLDVAVVSDFALKMFYVVAMTAVIFVTFELHLAGRFRFDRGSLKQAAIGIAAIMALIMGYRLVLGGIGPENCLFIAQWGIGLFLAFSLLCALFHGFCNWKEKTSEIHWHSYLIPLIPLLLILVYEVPFVPAFLCGFIFGIVSTMRRGSLNMTSRAVIEGSQSVIPAVVLMLGIGMLLNSILGPSKNGGAARWYKPTAQSEVVNPADLASGNQQERVWPVTKDIEPLLAFAVPSSGWHFVLIFTLLAPLALYRGPLNVWGLGYGVTSVLIS